MTGSSPQRWRLPEEYLTLYSTWLWLKINSHKQDLKLGPKHFIQQVFKLQMKRLSSVGHWLNQHCVVYNNLHDNLLQFNYVTLNHRFSPLSQTGKNIKQIFKIITSASFNEVSLLWVTHLCAVRNRAASLGLRTCWALINQCCHIAFYSNKSIKRVLTSSPCDEAADFSATFSLQSSSWNSREHRLVDYHFHIVSSSGEYNMG